MLMHRFIPFVFVFLIYDAAHATSCDVGGFWQECEMPIHAKPTATLRSYSFCTSSYGYLTSAQFDQLTRYHRQGVNIVLKVDGELVDVKCVPGRRMGLS